MAAAGCVPELYTGVPELASDWEAPENGWTVATPPADLEGEGFDEGDVVPDFRLLDQHGDEVSLWQFYGDVVLLDISTVWCPPCQELALHTEDTWLDYRDQGFTYLTVLHQDLDSGPPDEADLDYWADFFGVTAPVLADGAPHPGTGAALDEIVEYPVLLVIKRNLKVRERVDPPVDAAVRAAIEAAL